MSIRTLDIGPLRLQANRFALISRLADDLAHEVKNPLHAMVINLELLRRRILTGVTDEALERVEVVEEEIRHVHLIVEAMFQLLRPSKDGNGPVELDLVLAELLPLLELRARLAGVALGYTRAGDGHVVNVSPADLKQLVLNLVEEALSSVSAGTGRIELSGCRGPLSVELRVTHNGVPAPNAAGQGDAGSGQIPVGVDIARAIIEARGGRIEREPSREEAMGNVYVVALPPLAGA